LLRHILGESILFQEDPDEPDLWLASLPSSRRSPGTESPDGASLTDEADGVITFLDDCVQRCLKTPYRYIEDLYDIRNTDNHGLDVYPSPLFMTVLEQLSIKIEKKSLSPSDVLALATFVRKLVVGLMKKLEDVEILLAVAGKVDGMLTVDRLFAGYPIITAAIRREVALLRACLEPPFNSLQPSRLVSKEVQDFLTQVEQIPVRSYFHFHLYLKGTDYHSYSASSKHARVVAAYELIDWLRLVEQPLGVDEIRRLCAILVKLHFPALLELGEQLDPAKVSFWDVLGVVSQRK
jgi:nucleolar pre-ribosomal-associated protein 1